MRRRTSIINTGITLLITVGLVFVSAYQAGAYYKTDGFLIPILFYFIGAVVFGFINAFIHEIGHLIAYKKNKFYILGFCVWFFKWTRINKKMRFDFTLIGEEAGYTEAVPVGADNMEKRYKNNALGGLIASCFAMFIGVGLMFFAGKVGLEVYCVLSMMLPVSAYYFFGNALPMINGGVYNDGAVILLLNKKTDSAKVAVSLLKAQAQIFEGKTPGEVEKELLFDVPQLPEDDLNFVALLDARYNYYIDNEDFENAKKVADRMYSLIEDLPKNYKMTVNLNVLYNCCTFDYNDELADDIMYDCESYLNSYNSATNLRVKFAYSIYVKKEFEYAEEFYELGVKRARKMPIKGLGVYEEKLLNRIKHDITGVEKEND